MLFTTSIIWQNLEVYEDEIQEWIEYATGMSMFRPTKAISDIFLNTYYAT